MVCFGPILMNPNTNFVLEEEEWLKSCLVTPIYIISQPEAHRQRKGLLTPEPSEYKKQPTQPISLEFHFHSSHLNTLRNFFLAEFIINNHLPNLPIYLPSPVT